jgi:class 3 adenylate cyclase/tetratricopeptide (TPR) repeat protein
MTDEIRAWLESIGLGKYGDVFVEAEVDLDTLSILADEDLQSLGLPLGPRRKLQQALAGRNDGMAPRERQPQPGEQPANERRQVTVLFADLSGFTRLSNELGSEETHALLNRYFDIVDAVVSAYGGKIDKHVGDAVMALFGAPIARTDDPVRALRAALDIHASLAKFGTNGDRALAAHIGVASGQVVAARTGSASYSEYTVTGETVNLASRLQDMAEPCETLISSEVYHAVSHAIECFSRGVISVDGFTKPIGVWSAGSVISPGTLSQRGPFVGREVECRQFQVLAAQGIEDLRGKSILVRGEPGIGKTRLVEQFVTLAQGLGYSAHRGLVLDFGTGRGQDAIGALLRSLIGTAPAATEAERSEAASRAIADGLIAVARKVFLNDLLDLPQSVELQSQYDAMKMETREEGKRAAFAELVSNLAASHPLVLVVEDIHWADDRTLGYLEQLASSIESLPVLLVMTSRVDTPASGAASWLAALLNAVTTTMELQPLSRNETLVLAHSLLETESSGVDAMAERSEGNPLFLEQLVRNASDNAGNLPGTIQGLVLARVDRLEAIDREALRAASVIGQDFSLEALRAVMMARTYDVTPLIRHRLIRPHGAGFLFDHALVRDAVYSSFLTSRKKELHARAAAYFEGLDPVLHAEHLHLAGDAAAPQAYLAAADLEANAYRTERACSLVMQGLAIASDPHDRFSLQCRLGEWELDLGLPEKARESLTAAAGLASGDIDYCRVNIGLASALRLNDRQSEALALLEEVEAVALRGGLSEYLSRICHLRGNLMFVLGRLEECRDQHDQARSHALDADSRDLEARALGGLADASYAVGRLLTAHKQFRQCVELAEELGLGRVAVANRSMVAITQFATGNIQGALVTSLAAVEAARNVGQDRAAMIAHHAAHQALWYLGRVDEDRFHCEQSLLLARKLGAPLFEAEALVFHSEMERFIGNTEAALDYARQALNLSRKYGMKFQGPMNLAAVAWATGDAGERQQCLLEGEALLAAGSISHNYFWFYRDAIEVSLDLGNWDEADRYADALETYFSSEPMPFANFFIDRCRVLTGLRRGSPGHPDLTKLRDLFELAKSSFVPFAAKLASVLDSQFLRHGQTLT